MKLNEKEAVHCCMKQVHFPCVCRNQKGQRKSVKECGTCESFKIWSGCDYSGNCAITGEIKVSADKCDVKMEVK